MDRLACMQIFVKAVERGSLTAAAEELDMSSQLAGKQMRALEQSLGIKLLNRTTRRQSLTESGRVFYERAKNILAEMEAAEALIADTRRMTSASAERDSQVLRLNRRMFRRILEEYPDIAVVLHRRVAEQLQALVRRIGDVASRFDV